MSMLRSTELEELFASQRSLTARLADLVAATPNTDSVYADLVKAANNATTARQKLERVVFTLKVEEITTRITQDQAKKAKLEAELATK